MSNMSPEGLEHLPHAPPTLLFQLYFIFVQKQNCLLTNLIIMKKSMWKYETAINSSFFFFTILLNSEKTCLSLKKLE